MRNVVPLTQRELSGYVYSPIAYLSGTAFLLLTGILFTSRTLQAGQDSTVQPLFAAMASAFVLCVPVLTMRLLADEYASGTIETLMTAPVTDVEVVVSKFLGVWLFYVALLATTLVHIVIIGFFGQIDVGATIASYIGMLLLGAMFAAIGLFASSMTRHQLIAALVGVGILSILTFVTDWLSEQFSDARFVLGYLNVSGQFERFGRGNLDLPAAVYFLSGTAFFLFLAVKILESKRWR